MDKSLKRCRHCSKLLQEMRLQNQPTVQQIVAGAIADQQPPLQTPLLPLAVGIAHQGLPSAASQPSTFAIGRQGLPSTFAIGSQGLPSTLPSANNQPPGLAGLPTAPAQHQPPINAGPINTTTTTVTTTNDDLRGDLQRIEAALIRIEEQLAGQLATQAAMIMELTGRLSRIEVTEEEPSRSEESGYEVTEPEAQSNGDVIVMQ